MPQDFARRFYGTQEWKKLRKYVWSRDGGLCQDCLKKGLYTPAEEVHHIIELSPETIDNPEISMNPENLICLCRECHHRRHNPQSWKRYKVDEFGRVTILED